MIDEIESWLLFEEGELTPEQYEQMEQDQIRRETEEEMLREEREFFIEDDIPPLDEFFGPDFDPEDDSLLVEEWIDPREESLEYDDDIPF